MCWVNGHYSYLWIGAGLERLHVQVRASPITICPIHGPAWRLAIDCMGSGMGCHIAAGARPCIVTFVAEALRVSETCEQGRSSLPCEKTRA